MSVMEILEMLCISDLGIFLEMIGFGLFLVSAKGLPSTANLLKVGENTTQQKINKKWKWTHWEMQGQKAQFSRIIAIGLIIFGLFLQFSFIS